MDLTKVQIVGASRRCLDCRTEDEANPFPRWNIKPTNVSRFPPVRQAAAAGVSCVLTCVSVSVCV